MIDVEEIARGVARRLAAADDPLVYVDPDVDDYDGSLTTVVAATVAELNDREPTIDLERLEHAERVIGAARRWVEQDDRGNDDAAAHALIDVREMVAGFDKHHPNGERL